MSKPDPVKEREKVDEEDEEEYEEEERDNEEEETKHHIIQKSNPVCKPTIFYEDGKPSSKFRIELFDDLRVLLVQQKEADKENSQDTVVKSGTWVSSKFSTSAKWSSCVGIRWGDASSTVVPVNVSDNGLLILNNERTFITLQY